MQYRICVSINGFLSFLMHSINKLKTGLFILVQGHLKQLSCKHFNSMILPLSVPSGTGRATGMSWILCKPNMDYSNKLYIVFPTWQIIAAVFPFYKHDINMCCSHALWRVLYSWQIHTHKYSWGCVKEKSGLSTPKTPQCTLIIACSSVFVSNLKKVNLTTYLQLYREAHSWWSQGLWETERKVF